MGFSFNRDLSREGYNAYWKAVTVGAITLTVAVSSAAQGITANAQRQIGALLAEKAGRTAAQAKMDSHLVHAAKILRGQPVHPDFPVPTGELQAVRLDSRNYVEVDIRAAVTSDLLASIRSLGGAVVNAFPQYEAVRASLPLQSVEQVAARSEVRQIRVADAGRLAGAPLSLTAGSRADMSARGQAVRSKMAEYFGSRQAAHLPAMALGGVLRSLDAAYLAGPDAAGDVAHQADVVRAKFGFDGSGVKVGVLSDGVASLAAEQAAGRLPKVNVIETDQGSQAGSGDEGTALLEIVYSLAPGATLYFATAQGGQANMANNIQALASYGCKVIVDDSSYFAEGVFQDGIIARTVNELADDGILYVTAAGNSGNARKGTSGTWQGDFADSGITQIFTASNRTVSGILHSFGSTSYNTLTELSQVPAINGAVGQYELKWSDPLGQSNNDYDLFILDPTGQQVVASSTTTQNGTQDPEEYITGNQKGVNPHSPAADLSPGCRIVIIKHVGAAVRTLHLDTERGALAFGTDSAVFGHAAAKGVTTVAAVDGRWPGGGAFTEAHKNLYVVQDYSSDGPRRMFYNPDGSPIRSGVTIADNGGDVLSKPDLTAADCVPTGAPGWEIFCGSSASAPHVAAVMALLLDAQPTITPAQLRAALASSAIDIEDPGADKTSGAGIMMAPGAVNAACGYSVSPSRVAVPVSGGNFSLTVQASAGCRWNIIGLPEWLSGAVSGTGPATVSLTAPANAGGSRTANLQAAGAAVVVTQAAVPLAIATSSPLLTGSVNWVYSQTLSATGGTPPYKWSGTGLPYGLSLSETGVISGTASQGTYNVTVQVTDSASVETTKQFSLKILAAAAGLTRTGALSHIASGGSWDTSIYLINNSASDVQVELQFHKDDGQALELPLKITQEGNVQQKTATTVDAVLKADTTMVLASGEGVASYAQGWADVLTSAPVSGFAIFRYAPNGFTKGEGAYFTPYEGTVPLQTQFSASTMIVPFDNTGGFLTGFAVGTLSASGTKVTATAYDDNGLQLATAQQDLKPNGHYSNMVANFFVDASNKQLTADKRGIVVLTGTQLVGLGLRASPYGTLTSVPAVLK